jgi:hypothetical protein
MFRNCTFARLVRLGDLFAAPDLHVYLMLPLLHASSDHLSSLDVLAPFAIEKL